MGLNVSRPHSRIAFFAFLSKEKTLGLEEREARASTAVVSDYPDKPQQSERYIRDDITGIEQRTAGDEVAT